MELLRVLLYAVQEYNFPKFAEICVATGVAILDDGHFFVCFYCNIYEMKPDIFLDI